MTDDDNNISPEEHHDADHWDEPTMLDFKLNVPTITLSLIVKSPMKVRGRVFSLKPGQVIGRKDADVLLNDKRVSRQHARINRETGADGNPVFALYDFGTPNGTFVNGERILGRAIVQHQDEIQMGDHIFVLEVSTESA